MHSDESRFVIGSSNTLSAGMYVCTFQPGNFTGCGSEVVNQRKQQEQTDNQQRCDVNHPSPCSWQLAGRCHVRGRAGYPWLMPCCGVGTCWWLLVLRDVGRHLRQRAMLRRVGGRGRQGGGTTQHGIWWSWEERAGSKELRTLLHKD